MTDKLVWVVYKSYDAESCGEPLAAFSTREKAKEWVDLKRRSEKASWEIEPLLLDGVKLRGR